MSGKLRLFGNENAGLREVWLAKRSLLSLSEAAEFGGEGSRTPVLKTIAPNVYMLSRPL